MLDAFRSRMLGIKWQAPESAAAERQMRHQVGMQIGKAPEGRSGFGIPVVAAQRHPGCPFLKWR